MMSAARHSSIVGSLVFSLLFAVSLSGCGGKSGSDSSGASGTFTPDQANPGANTISLNASFSGGDVYLAVKANAVTDSIFGAAFDLVFDPAVLTYVDYSAGDFFEKTGDVTYAVSLRNNRIIAGGSGKQPGTGAGGDGTVITLHFKAKAAGSSPMTFENQALCSAASTTGCDRTPSLSWYGGTYSGG